MLMLGGQQGQQELGTTLRKVRVLCQLNRVRSFMTVSRELLRNLFSPTTPTNSADIVMSIQQTMEQLGASSRLFDCLMT